MEEKSIYIYTTVPYLLCSARGKVTNFFGCWSGQQKSESVLLPGRGHVQNYMKVKIIYNDLL
jgi:hypothetical protein